jgi:hypothetical protein
MHSEHDQIVAPVTKDDSILRDIIPRLEPSINSLSRTKVDLSPSRAFHKYLAILDQLDSKLPTTSSSTSSPSTTDIPRV